MASNMKKIIAFEDRGWEFTGGVQELRAEIDSWVAAVSEEHMDSVIIDLSPYEDREECGAIDVEVSYSRPHTDEEMEELEASGIAYMNRKIESERELMAKLMKKYIDK